MAKKSAIEKNKIRIKKVEKFADRRKELKKNPSEISKYGSVLTETKKKNISGDLIA